MGDVEDLRDDLQELRNDLEDLEETVAKLVSKASSEKKKED